ncbi:Os01g0381400 [Oryza sativa Japonica Group]|uniref:Os01g0381400 protein n=1 Tax=Oryza sativa subsp. japonica TaxID=39947 RepID=A0A0N7KCZ9_ORYSJ|nr:Os01g0381400 [Oryza sativa Japonica Group]
MIATAVCTQSRRYDGLRFSQRKPVNVDVYPLYHLAPSLCVTYLMALQADEDVSWGMSARAWQRLEVVGISTAWLGDD